MASLKKSLNDYLKDSKSKKSKGGDTNRDEALQSFFGGSDIFSTFIRSKFKSKKQPGEKNTGGGDNESSTISQDSSVFLKIIAKNEKLNTQRLFSFMPYSSSLYNETSSFPTGCILYIYSPSSFKPHISLLGSYFYD